MVRTRSMRKTSQLTPKIPPSDVITEILYRLPAKSVGRFRCVSKGWLALLTDPQFIKTHKEKTLIQHHLIFEPKSNKYGYGGNTSCFLYTHPFNEIVVTTPAKFSLQLKCGGPIQNIIFSGSCDGLVLVSLYCCEGPFILILVNPTTSEKLELPEDYYFEEVSQIEGDAVCFASTVMYGFGYDSVTDDYKVVALIYYEAYLNERDDDDDKVECVYVYVYSLKSNTWRRVIKTDSPFYDNTSDGVFVNGFIYWILSNHRPRPRAIATFCLANETFSQVPFPKFCNTLNGYSCELVVLGEKLAIFQPNKGEIWLMNDSGVRKSWTKISLHGINKIPIFKPERYRKGPLVLYDNDQILVANNDRMMVYDVENGTFSETLCVWNPKKLSVLGSYVESLISLKHRHTT